MLFPRHNPSSQSPPQIKPTINLEVADHSLIMSARDTLTRLHQGHFSEQPFTEAFCTLRRAYSIARRYPGGASSEALPISLATNLNSLVDSYEGLLGDAVRRTYQELRGAGRILDVLRPHFALKDGVPREDHFFDDADLIFHAALGLDYRALDTGIGRRYMPTPLRHLETVLSTLELRDSDRIDDWGCGVGVTLLAAAVIARERGVKAKFFGIEGCEALAQRAISMVRRFQMETSVTIRQGNFFEERKSDVSVVILFEPVDSDEAGRLVSHLAGISRDSALRICAFAPPRLDCHVANALDNHPDFQRITNTTPNCRVFELNRQVK